MSLHTELQRVTSLSTGPCRGCTGVWRLNISTKMRAMCWITGSEHLALWGLWHRPVIPSLRPTSQLLDEARLLYHHCHQWSVFSFYYRTIFIFYTWRDSDGYNPQEIVADDCLLEALMLWMMESEGRHESPPYRWTDDILNCYQQDIPEAVSGDGRSNVRDSWPGWSSDYNNKKKISWTTLANLYNFEHLFVVAFLKCLRWFVCHMSAVN